MPEELQPPTYEIYVSQAIIVVAVVVIFMLGVWFRSLIANDGATLRPKQAIAASVVVLVFGGVPLCQAVYNTLAAASQLFHWISAFVPVFAAGFASREEIKKYYKST